MNEHFNITLYGQVQGVFLRRTIKHEARRLGLAGFVQNHADGTVYLEAEGDANALEQFVIWLKQGAGEGDYDIADVDAVEGNFKALEEFEIRGE